MKLGEAVLDALGDRKQVWLAREIGVDASWVTRLIKGQQPALTIEMLQRIEQVLDVPKGSLFIAAGLVDPALTVEDAINQDRRLTLFGKDAVLAMHHHFVAGRGDR